jgi:quinol-cytochrome oxidoreductase complex cytochrome b subunit/mono/diheme cytochrome c family protein
VLSRLCAWLDHRTGYKKFLDMMLLEHIPGGAKWRYVWGSVLAFVFTLQLITGLLLMTAYSPGDTTAWGSVYFIQYEMQFGWLIRGLHHFGSQMMVVLLGVHMLQVVIAGAHLAPREINWWLGLALMGCVLGLSLTGYLLPWDQKGFWATQVATGIAGSMPGLGEFVKLIIVGGHEYGNHTVTRFYTLHVGVLPPLIVVLLILHVAVFRRHGVTAPKNAEHEGEGLFWPDQAFKDMVVCMLMFALLLGIVIWGGQGTPQDREDGAAEPSYYESLAYAGRDGAGANLDAPADPSEPYPARPEWYFLSLFQLLKYFEGPDRIVGTVVIPNGIGVLLFLLPLFGYGKMRPLGQVIGVLVVVGVLAGAGTLTLLAIADDMADPVNRYFVTQLGLVGIPVIAAVFLILLALLALLPRGAFRGIVYAAGVVVLGILALGVGSGLYGAMSGRLLEPIREVAREQAPTGDEVNKKTTNIEGFRRELEKAERKAERAVVVAHRGIPPGGAVLLLQRDPMTRGKELFKQHCLVCHRFGSEFNGGGTQASDLAGFASPDPAQRQAWIRDLLEHAATPKYFGFTPLEGMKNWSAKMHANRAKMADKDRAEYNAWLDEVSAWLASRPDRKDPYKAIEGYEGVAAEGGVGTADPLASDPFARGFRAFFDDDKKGYCSGCHGYKGGGSGSAPDLTGYGSPEWTRLMIMSPGHKLRHGKYNMMPAFRPDADPAKSPGGEVGRLEFKDYQPDTPVFTLSDVDRELIIRYLLRDDRLVFFGEPVAGSAEKTSKKR